MVHGTFLHFSFVLAFLNAFKAIRFFFSLPIFMDNLRQMFFPCFFSFWIGRKSDQQELSTKWRQITDNNYAFDQITWLTLNLLMFVIISFGIVGGSSSYFLYVWWLWQKADDEKNMFRETESCFAYKWRKKRKLS